MKNLKNLFRLFVRFGARSISWHSRYKKRAFFDRLYIVSRTPFPSECVTYHSLITEREKMARWRGGGEVWRSQELFLHLFCVGIPSKAVRGRAA